MGETNQTYDFICFAKLAYEFDYSDKKETENKIKESLRYYKLDSYDQERVDYLRRLKNDLYIEISSTTSSRYYQGPSSKYAALEDFDVYQMADDYLKKYDTVDRDELIRMINFSIYLYYMR